MIFGFYAKWRKARIRNSIKDYITLEPFIAGNRRNAIVTAADGSVSSASQRL
jgi:hypothetical protein